MKVKQSAIFNNLVEKTYLNMATMSILAHLMSVISGTLKSIAILRAR